MAERAKSPNERDLEALREVADILLPDSLTAFGYNKEAIIDGLLKTVDEGPGIIGLKMRMIFKVLKRCYEG